MISKRKSPLSIFAINLGQEFESFRARRRLFEQFAPYAATSIIILSQTPYDRLWRSYGFLGWFGDRRFARHALKGIRFAIYKFGPRAERNPTHIGAMEVGAKGELFLRDP